MSRYLTDEEKVQMRGLIAAYKIVDPTAYWITQHEEGLDIGMWAEDTVDAGNVVQQWMDQKWAQLKGEGDVDR
jgi:hypothetical protein